MFVTVYFHLYFFLSGFLGLPISCHKCLYDENCFLTVILRACFKYGIKLCITWLNCYTEHHYSSYSTFCNFFLFQNPCFYSNAESFQFFMLCCSIRNLKDLYRNGCLIKLYFVLYFVLYFKLIHEISVYIFHIICNSLLEVKKFIINNVSNSVTIIGTFVFYHRINRTKY